MADNRAVTNVPTDRHVLRFDQIDPTQVATVGGKGAHLAAVSRIDGVDVPPGFCVTTDAFRRVVSDAPALDGPLDRLSHLGPDDRDAICTVSAEIRAIIESIEFPSDLAEAITHRLADSGEDSAYAVRSSATAEDLSSASFAGQQDSYLNVVGPAAVIEHVRRCWASLFTERAVAYRLRNHFDHSGVQMAVVVQQMAFPHAAGVLFTADPVTSNRNVAAVEAAFGLGEALVSGAVNADSYRVRDGEIVDRAIATKKVAVHASSGGGTHEDAIAPELQTAPALSDAQVLQLVALGRRIESHFGQPQDIEWCLVDERLHILQSRPITTLFPIPATDDEDNHVYLSVGHQQMMTDAMTPLGLSVWQLTTPRPMAEAGGRLFVDVTTILGTPAREGLQETARRSDPLMEDALRTVLDRGFVPSLPSDPHAASDFGGAPAPAEVDPSIVAELIEQCQTSLATVERDIVTKSGPELLDFILDDFQELRRVLFDPQSNQAVMTAIESTWWINEHVQTWLGDTNASDVLTQSVPNNVTSEMGLELLDVADVIRPHPEVVAYLRAVKDDGFLDGLDSLEGGRESREAIASYLDRYGMRCIGEIDITRPRWNENPSALVPLILNNVENFEPGASRRRFEQGLREAQAKEEELLARLRALPDGAEKADETKQVIDRLRTFVGYREYPKYGMISRYSIYKRAILGEAKRLVAAGVLREAEDAYYLRFEELHEVVRTGQADHGLIDERKEALRSYRSLEPPRVLTSEGEAISGAYRRDEVPDAALAGVPVCAGSVEGRARVVLDVAGASLGPDDILVTAYTDPSWSPMFVTIKALVTEVGGLMTHGAVVAREYGLPAVVGVADATKLIADGQRIRVDGTNGYVELLTS